MLANVTLLSPPERLAIARSRLNDLTGGSEPRLANLRDPSKNPDIVSRLELAYLVKLISALESNTRRAVYVETVIAGAPADADRRVFARVTHNPDEDGDVVELYTHTRGRRFESIPIEIRTTKPPRRRRNQEQA